MTEQAGTFVRWVDKKKNIALISFVGPEPVPVQENTLYDYELFPCSHTIKNKTYKEVEIEGNMFCTKCKRIRKIASIRIKRF